MNAPADYLAEALRQKIDKRLGQITGQLAGGAAHSYEAYRQQVGMVLGLNEARTMLNDLADPIVRDMEQESK